MILQTRRLVLRPLVTDHRDTLHALWTGTGVRRYLWDDEILSLSHTAEILERNERLFADQRLGLWGGWTKASDLLVGFAGFWYFRKPPELEILYGVSEDLWGRGFATEMAGAIIDYGFGSLAMPFIVGSTDAANRASSRVMERLGFELSRRETVDGLDTVFYELRRSAPSKGGRTDLTPQPKVTPAERP